MSGCAVTLSYFDAHTNQRVTTNSSFILKHELRRIRENFLFRVELELQIRDLAYTWHVSNLIGKFMLRNSAILIHLLFPRETNTVWCRIRGSCVLEPILESILRLENYLSNFLVLRTMIFLGEEGNNNQHTTWNDTSYSDRTRQEDFLSFSMAKSE